MPLTLLPLKRDYSVWQPPVSHAINLADFQDSEFFTLSRSANEQSIVCPADRVPENAPGKIEGPWNSFKVEGQLDFSLVGIMAEISGLLAHNKISLFAISTFDTDYVLVKKEKFEEAKQALATKFTIGE